MMYLEHNKDSKNVNKENNAMEQKEPPKVENSGRCSQN